VSNFGLCKKCLTRRVSEISLPLVTQLTRQTPVTPLVVNDALALLGLVLVILLGLVLIAGGGPPLL